MLYIKYAASNKDIVSQRKVAQELIDYVLYSAFGIKNIKNSILKSNSGKPYIKDAGFDFSIAHTGFAAAVAACGRGDKKKDLVCIDEDVSKIGVDIESKNRTVSRELIWLICKKFYSEKEREYVAVGTIGDSQRFLEIWTRKESIAKATGEGLSGMRNADSFSYKVRYLETRYITIENKKYILSVAGL